MYHVVGCCCWCRGIGGSNLSRHHHVGGHLGGLYIIVVALILVPIDFYFVLKAFALTIPAFFSGLSIFAVLCSFLALSASSPIGVALCADK